MNQTPSRSSRRRLRRLIALAGGALVGMTAVFALAAPASAHHPIVTGKAVCDTTTGEWVVTWQVANSERDITGKLTAVSWTPADTELTGIEVGSILPKSGDGVLEGVQKVAADQTGASLEVTAEWWRWIKKKKVHIVESGTGEVTFEGECKTPESPSPSPSESASPSAPAESPSVPASETPSPVPGGGGGESLPTTGASIGTAVGIAAVLVAAGTGLFFFFRRRRIRFTA